MTAEFLLLTTQVDMVAMEGKPCKRIYVRHSFSTVLFVVAS